MWVVIKKEKLKCFTKANWVWKAKIEFYFLYVNLKLFLLTFRFRLETVWCGGVGQMWNTSNILCWLANTSFSQGLFWVIKQGRCYKKVLWLKPLSWTPLSTSFSGLYRLSNSIWSVIHRNLHGSGWARCSQVPTFQHFPFPLFSHDNQIPLFRKHLGELWSKWCHLQTATEIIFSQ